MPEPTMPEDARPPEPVTLSAPTLIASPEGAPVAAPGGAPFGEPLLMWWNFAARTGEEITRAREDWVAGRFGQVHGYPGAPLTAPSLPSVPLKSR